MPLPNVPAAATALTPEITAQTLNIPQSSNFGVVRIDHDFGEKWHFNGTYHYYKNVPTTTSQVDIGGALPGDTFGVPTAKSIRPVVPSLMSAGMTTNITSNTTNDFHFNFLRNFWQWTDQTPIPQLPGLGGALEIGGETSNASDSLQRELAEHAAALLGWARPDVAG